MKYWKKLNGECGTMDDDGFVPDSIEIAKIEYDKYIALDLPEAIPARQNQIKQECTSYILAAYPEPIQRSAVMGIYSSEVVNTMTTFIAGCIEEENRCYDLIAAAATLEEVDAVVPTFPEAKK